MRQMSRLPQTPRGTGMMVMIGNNSSGVVHYFAGKYPNRIGWIISPDGWKTPRHYLPYALDNGAYTAFTNGEPWNEQAWRQMLAKARLSGKAPRWVLIPDVVCDRAATLLLWNK